MEKICVLYWPVWSYASIPSVSRRMTWKRLPVTGSMRSMGADQIHKPLVHGRTVGPTLNPDSFPALHSWLRM